MVDRYDIIWRGGPYPGGFYEIHHRGATRIQGLPTLDEVARNMHGSFAFLDEQTMIIAANVEGYANVRQQVRLLRESPFGSYRVD